MSLNKYKEKRNFGRTPEPDPEFDRGKKEKPIFVVQKHWARRLHYDFRIETKGVLKSWAVPNGISNDPMEKKLAVMVEDHPYRYKDFEGEIPEGEYGAGQVRIWDKGSYNTKSEEKNAIEKDVEDGIKKGHLYVFLDGQKLKGGFNLVKMDDKNWLLIKSNDEFSGTEIKEDTFKFSKIKEKAEKIDFSSATKARMPEIIFPMLAESKENPFDDSEWIFEIKWDGYRVVSFLKNGQVQMKSRNNLLIDYFDGIEKELAEMPIEAILDGEVAVLNSKGLPDFQLLQNYIKSQKGQAVYYIFDILYLNGYSLLKVPLIDRKRILRQILPDSNKIKFVDYIKELGEIFFEQAKRGGLEGIVAKKSASYYVPGQRSQDWIKIKSARRQELVIGGFTQPKGSRKYFGSLLLGTYENGKLTYAGNCGGGFSEEKLQYLYRRMYPLIQLETPFSPAPPKNEDVIWVKPEIVCEIKFSEWTSAGIMRHPVFIGIRDDKRPQDVRKENFFEEFSTEIFLTNLEKEFWPAQHYKKKDLVDYYKKISGVIFKYLKNRPVVLHRFPDGILGESFFQKNVDPVKINLPKWVRTEKIKSEQGQTNYIICRNIETLIYLANLGCITMHPWNSRIEKLDNPDYVVLDYDAKESTFKKAVKTAQIAHEILLELDVPHFLKTSGGSGLHIYIPLETKYTHEQTQNFAKIINQLTFLKDKEISTLIRDPQKRNGKVYLDSYQNGRGKTLASVYSLRPINGAPVSAPVSWEEVDSVNDPAKFNIKTVFDRLNTIGDLWEELLYVKGANLEKILDKIQSMHDL